MDRTRHTTSNLHRSTLSGGADVLRELVRLLAKQAAQEAVEVEQCQYNPSQNREEDR